MTKLLKLSLVFVSVLASCTIDTREEREGDYFRPTSTDFSTPTSASCGDLGEGVSRCTGPVGWETCEGGMLYSGSCLGSDTCVATDEFAVGIGCQTFGVCDDCVVDDCPESWRGDGPCDECLGNDPDCTTAPPEEECSEWFGDCGCPESWRGDGQCDACLGNDPDCSSTTPPPQPPPNCSNANDGYCQPGCMTDPDCFTGECPESFRYNGRCDECLGDDPECSSSCTTARDGHCQEGCSTDLDCWVGDCPEALRFNGQCDTCLGDDPECGGSSECGFFSRVEYRFDAGELDWDNTNMVSITIKHDTPDGSIYEGYLHLSDRQGFNLIETLSPRGCEASAEIRRNYSMRGGITCIYTDRIDSLNVIIPAAQLDGNGGCTAPSL